MHRKDQNLRAGIVFEHLARGLKAVQRGHADVQNGDVRLDLLRFFYGFTPVARFRRYLPTGLSLENAAQSFPHDFVVVGN